MRIVYAPRALRDIDDILSYIHQRSPSGAANVSRAIEHAIGVCALNPLMGAKTDEPNLYRWPIGTYRYTVFYRPLSVGDGIEVARVIHGARVRNLRQMPEE